MAVDPNTGQTVFDPRNLAAFMDPSAMAGIQSGLAQGDQQSQLAQAMLSRGYTPNSGGFGAIAQVLQSLAGMQMLKKSQENMQQVYQQQAQALSDAHKAQHTESQADLDAAEKRAIAQATGIHSGDLATDLANAPQMAAAAGMKSGAESQAQLPAQTALEKLKGGYTLAAANYLSRSVQGYSGRAGFRGDFARRRFKAAIANRAAPPIPQAAALNPKDQAAVDKRVPVLQDQVNKVDTALELAQNLKARMHAGDYGNTGGATGLYNSYAPTAVQTQGAQQLGTDAGNLILAAQGALQGTGSRGSVAQLRILQTSKPNAALDKESNINAIDTITKELQQARSAPAAELEHYGSGGTPTSWAQTSAKQATSAPATSSGGFKEGQIYTDAKGNKAMYQNAGNSWSNNGPLILLPLCR